MPMTRQKFEEKVETLKILSEEKSNSMVEYTYDDIDSWLVEYENRNEDIETTLQNLTIDLIEIQGELFNIKFKQEVIVAPLREYIQEWLNMYLIKIYKSPMEEVNTINKTITKKDT
jgi:hypothetical protein